MIRISICDDDMVFTDNLKQYLKIKNEKLQSEKLNVSVHRSGEGFLTSLEHSPLPHIVFMDIEMAGITGIQVGHALKSMPNGDDVILIYMSSHDSYYEGVAHVGNFRFLTKPIHYAKLDDVLNKAISKVLKDVGNRARNFLYHINKDIFSIRVNEIVYLKCHNKTISIYTWGDQDKSISFHDNTYSSITATVEQLPSTHFIQCERSHIINLDYVRR